jgi:hypothetical protein
MSKHTMIAEIERRFTFPGLADGEYEVAYPKIEITYRYLPGSPAVYYQRNGDPGWPAEPAEMEVISAKLIDGDGLTPTAKEVEEWASEWLDDDSGYRLACENADQENEDNSQFGVGA